MEKTVVISGAGGSLGSAMVDTFLGKKYFVAGIYHEQPGEHKNVSQKEFVVDLSNESETEKTVSEILDLRKTIDVLICTAGGFAMNNIQNATAEDLQKQYDLNFKTAYNLVRPVYSHMKERGSGHIFLVGSRQGLHPATGSQSIAYTLSKSLLFSLAQVLNTDSKGSVVVSMIVPSVIDTAANRESMPDADFKKWTEPGQIAEIVAFYASDIAGVIRKPVIEV